MGVWADFWAPLPGSQLGLSRPMGSGASPHAEGPYYARGKYSPLLAAARPALFRGRRHSLIPLCLSAARSAPARENGDSCGFGSRSGEIHPSNLVGRRPRAGAPSQRAAWTSRRCIIFCFLFERRRVISLSTDAYQCMMACHMLNLRAADEVSSDVSFCCCPHVAEVGDLFFFGLQFMQEALCHSRNARNYFFFLDKFGSAYFSAVLRKCRKTVFQQFF